jgi:hypothetical protein
VRSSALMRAFRTPPQVAIRRPTGRKGPKALPSHSLRHARFKSWSFRTVCKISARSESVRKPRVSRGRQLPLSTLVHHANLVFFEPARRLESLRGGAPEGSRVENSSLEDAVRFVRDWTAAPRSRRSSVGERMPTAAVRAAALTHPDPLVRRSCLFFLDHYDCDDSVETFRRALRDPVSFVRESALHGIACERCRHEEICVSDMVGDLVRLLASDTPIPKFDTRRSRRLVDF